MTSPGPGTVADSPVGLHRVLEPPGVLPQAAWRLDPDPALRPSELRIRVQRLNLDAASFRQLRDKHDGDGDASARRSSTSSAPAARCRTRSPAPAACSSGWWRPSAPTTRWGVAVGEQVTTLVSLSLTPLRIEDELAGWDGRSEQVPCDGTAILFGRSIVARVPDDLPGALAMAVMDVCGAAALVTRVVSGYVDRGRFPTVAVIGGAGKSGSLSLAAARRAGAAATVGIVPVEHEAAQLREATLADHVVDRRRPRPGRGVRGGRRRVGRPRRRHGRLRRRARVRARRDPGDGGAGHRRLLLDGHLVLGGGARGRGTGRRRHDADRQRLRAGARRPRARPGAYRPGRTVALRARQSR